MLATNEKYISLPYIKTDFISRANIYRRSYLVAVRAAVVVAGIS
jgi:hypothetical protein